MSDVLLLTPAQAAEVLRVRESWLRRRAAERRVPCCFVGKHLRFSRADLEAIVADGARPAREAQPRHRRRLWDGSRPVVHPMGACDYPCRRLRINAGAGEERPVATPAQVSLIAGRARLMDRVVMIMAAYGGMRWGELAGLQWRRVDLDRGQLAIDAKDGALHEVGGTLTLGSPKTKASVRIVHLPPFLVELLAELRESHPGARYVFTAVEGGWHRRANFRRRVWLPAVAGDTKRGWDPIAPDLHFHDLRHTHNTWLIEDHVPDVLRHRRMGHRQKGVSGIYSHVTPPMIDAMLDGLQRRWEQYGSTDAGDHYLGGSVVKISCSQYAPTTQKRPVGDDHQQAV